MFTAFGPENAKTEEIPPTKMIRFTCDFPPRLGECFVPYLVGEKVIFGLSRYAMYYREEIYNKALKAYYRDLIPSINRRYGIIYLAFFVPGTKDFNSFPLIQDWVAEACRHISKRKIYKQYLDKVGTRRGHAHVLVEFGVEEEFDSRIRYLTRQTNQEKIEFDRKFRELHE